MRQIDGNIYIVTEINNDGKIITEMFNHDREKAVQFLKERRAIIKQSHKDWQESVGINFFMWENSNQNIKLYLKILEDNNTNEGEESV